MEKKIKHLEFIQATINRMAGNSFLLKGWAVTLVGALLALSFKETSFLYVIISVAVLYSFWFLDGYYLSRERLFIRLYDHVRVQPDASIDFSMDTQLFSSGISWIGCALSRTIVLFYGGLLLAHLIIIIAL
jgi:hypothetical protein